MTFQEFLDSTRLETPPVQLEGALLALWLDKSGDWEGAHDTAQGLHSQVGDWIHAYLHRKEGDVGNARYWYARASRPECKESLDREWRDIAQALLNAD